VTVKISASIIAAELVNIEKIVKQLEVAGVDIIHVDSMDGHFFHYIGLGPHVIKAIKKVAEIPVDVHLAVEEPERILSTFLETGVDSISIQLEACRFPLRVIRRIKSVGVKAGVAILPSTPISQIAELVKYVDFVLLLSNNNSFFVEWHDAEFLPETFDRIRKLREIAKDYNIEIAVDGGVSKDIIPVLVKNGADILVMGRAVFQGDIEKNVKEIRSIIEESTRF